ncbi:DnaJ domain-containing protein [Ramlibacter sp. USB13]|uniref:DnaJ domain-containing protein n=1 Tax=Ramlibacter cellulosilyticus TaxID=2764187 RepID=A0A923MX42_9BURK|nr:DnaJ domain-containing protein [Ramlibacter cellulosilyticus]
MEIEDPYATLGLTPEASDAQIKAAWRRLSARWHPDRNATPQALERIQRINRAVEQIRSAREEARDTADDAPPPAAAPTPKDEPVELTITLSLEEAASGCIRNVHGEVTRVCATCCGTGKAPEPVTCHHCHGQGQARQMFWFPWLATPLPCDACEGRGSTLVSCSSCGGSGESAPLAYRARVRIPPGVRDGHQLHARVKLQDGKDHQSLNVRVALRPHAFLSLQEDGTIRVDVPVDGFAWVAGRWTEVPTLDGMRRMRLQRGALTYRIREAGFPVRPSGARADCLVSVTPLFPAEWSERQAALLDALIHSNTQDESTEAGARVRAWNRMVAAWAQPDGDTPEN